MRRSRPAHSRSRSTNFCTFPVDVLGSSPNSTAAAPSDGFYVRIGQVSTEHPTIDKGYNRAYRGFAQRVVTLPFGKTWYSSDASAIVCTSRSTGLTCRHPSSGLSFWLGRFRGYRIYVDEPGERPLVRPFFRTSRAYCGLNRLNLAPEVPGFVCWRPDSGLVVSVSHQTDGRGSFRREALAEGFRPAGFPMLRPGSSFAWRCREVTPDFAERCSLTRGTPVFTCSNEQGELTRKNVRGDGFYVGRYGFYVFWGWRPRVAREKANELEEGSLLELLVPARKYTAQAGVRRLDRVQVETARTHEAPVADDLLARVRELKFQPETATRSPSTTPPTSMASSR